MLCNCTHTHTHSVGAIINAHVCAEFCVGFFSVLTIFGEKILFHNTIQPDDRQNRTMNDQAEN